MTCCGHQECGYVCMYKFCEEETCVELAITQQFCVLHLTYCEDVTYCQDEDCTRLACDGKFCEFHAPLEFHTSIKFHTPLEFHTIIDFDEASKFWNANKRQVGKTAYAYVCGAVKRDGHYCKKKIIKGYQFDHVHCRGHQTTKNKCW